MHLAKIRYEKVVPHCPNCLSEEYENTSKIINGIIARCCYNCGKEFVDEANDADYRAQERGENTIRYITKDGVAVK